MNEKKLKVTIELDDFIVSDCQGVTFIGVVEKQMIQENCLLIKCHGECFVDSTTELSEGVSVKITRAIQSECNDDGELMLAVVLAVLVVNFTLNGIESTNTSSPSSSSSSSSSKAVDIFTSSAICPGSLEIGIHGRMISPIKNEHRSFKA
ncbi:unnamed protein product [Acanthocheilonema viteae]|uniref:Uncharacterized protein n=1 Tax=Acanthocheilonema viteae TaxID=6277 RepID=A0A498S3Q9_ACAVI|nr:unnamed protein product [Acanthocheilonema viteae]